MNRMIPIDPMLAAYDEINFIDPLSGRFLSLTRAEARRWLEVADHSWLDALNPSDVLALQDFAQEEAAL